MYTGGAIPPVYRENQSHINTGRTNPTLIQEEGAHIYTEGAHPFTGGMIPHLYRGSPHEYRENTSHPLEEERRSLNKTAG